MLDFLTVGSHNPFSCSRLYYSKYIATQPTWRCATYLRIFTVSGPSVEHWQNSTYIDTDKLYMQFIRPKVLNVEATTTLINATLTIIVLKIPLLEDSIKWTDTL
ncbi:MAG: hypothetical protein ACI8RD_007233 [Bacillariaceae sp.]|jgi:hypothetical protein